MTDQEKLIKYETALKRSLQQAIEMQTVIQTCKERNNWTIHNPEYLLGIQNTYLIWELDAALVENMEDSIMGKSLKALADDLNRGLSNE